VIDLAFIRMWSVDEEENDVLMVDISPGLQIKLYTAENDFNAEKKMLFATYVWSGSAVLAKELIKVRNLIENSTVIEFGAGAGLPSIVAAKLGASRVCCSDYPSALVLENLHKNMNQNNVNECVIVKDHIWGESVQNLLEANHHEKFDVVVAAECLWKHECHDVLLTYSHHIPGLEDSDDRFIELCINSNMEMVDNAAVPSKHMWSDKVIDVFICKFVLK
jgi:predicted nicotinamide N-methyase